MTLGVAIGIFLGAMAWIDSGMLLGGVAAFVTTAVVYGIVMHRRMARYWPGAKQLSGDDRVTVARTARRGERIGDARLAQAVIDYNRGMQDAAEKGRFFRWFFIFILVVSVGTAVWDGVYGSWGNAVASVILSGDPLVRTVLVAKEAGAIAGQYRPRGRHRSARAHANTSLSVTVCRPRLAMSWLSWL